MRRSLVASVLALGLAFATAGVGIAGNGTTVYRFADEPFIWDECYATTDWIPGPAAKFGEDVCVHYVALNSETVRFHGEDVAWTLTQHGTATITAADDSSVLYTGRFQVEEVARDDGGDANCSTPDGHAWLGECGGNVYTTLDFAKYNWKIAGVYFFSISVKGPGQYCYDAKGVAYGPGC